MKTILTIALLVVSQFVLAQINHEGMFAATLVSGMTTSAPTASLVASSQGLGNHNDIIMVNDDAVIAMETGFVSDDLASVIDKLKASDNQFAAASDEDIVAFIASLKQTSK